MLFNLPEFETIHIHNFQRNVFPKATTSNQSLFCGHNGDFSVLVQCCPRIVSHISRSYMSPSTDITFFNIKVMVHLSKKEKEKKGNELKKDVK